MDVKPEFAAADKAVARAAGKIEQAMVELLEKTLPLSDVVATDYVVETLADALIKRNPAALAWLTGSAAKPRCALLTRSWTGGICGLSADGPLHAACEPALPWTGHLPVIGITTVLAT